MREIHMCNNQKCLWSGPVESTKSLNPGIHFLCPDCGETTEEASDKEAAEYYVGWIGDLQMELDFVRATNDRQSAEIAVLLAEAKELRQVADVARRELAILRTAGDIAERAVGRLFVERDELRRKLADVKRERMEADEEARSD